MVAAIVGLVGVVVGYLLNFALQWFLAKRASAEASIEVRRIAYAGFLADANGAFRLAREIIAKSQQLTQDDPKDPLIRQQRSELFNAICAEFRSVAQNLDRSMANLHLLAPPAVRTYASDLQTAIWALRQDSMTTDKASEFYEKCATAFRFDLSVNAEVVASKALRNFSKFVNNKNKAITMMVDGPIQTGPDPTKQ